MSPPARPETGRFPRHRLLLLLTLLFAPAGAQERSDRAAPAPPGATEPVRFTSFSDPGLLSAQANTLHFAGIPPGTVLDRALGVYGLRLRLGDGPRPVAWVDRTPRCFPPPSLMAVSNAGAPDFANGTRRAWKGAPDACALAATFELAVNRVGFELRSLEEEELNVIVRCFAGGVELGSAFFEAGRDFRFIGVQSSRPFDELRVQFTNPSQALFSIDNLAHELDLRDTDRDGWPDFTDPCPGLPGFEQLDSDGDGLGDDCDAFPHDPENDADQDGLGAQQDNCPRLFNPDQHDGDRDGLGDACDDYPLGSDQDGDGIGDEADNCPDTFNPEQADCDADGIGDACDPSLIDPASVHYTLRPGDCITLEKSLCLPPAPAVVDVLILFDTTGSMGGEIQNLRNGVVGFINGVRSALPLSDIRFGLATFRDYPASFTTCNYSAQYALPTDSPFQVPAPIGSSNLEVLQAVHALVAGGGQDKYEAYARALWEVPQPDSGIGFRPDSARFVLLVGDSAPHDCNLGLLLQDCLPRILSSGGDPGRDGTPGTLDDIDFQEDALRGLRDSGTKLLMIYSGRAAFCAWERWCEATGGLAVQAAPNGVLPPGTNLVQVLVDLIRRSEVLQVTYAAENPCGLDVSFDPPVLDGPFDVSMGARVSFEETICVPAELPPGTRLDCAVRILADGVLLGEQSIHVEVSCDTFVLDFETEDDFHTPLLNGQALGTPPEFGRLVSISGAGDNLGPTIFDSTPGGPNDPSVNGDMLVGHGNLLLLQESQRPRQSVPGIFDVPTDDQDGGDLIFTFPGRVEPRSLLLADINPPPSMGASVTLLDEAGRMRVYTIQPGWTGTYGNAGPHRLDLTTLLPQPGNGTPRYATALETPGFQPAGVIQIVVHLTSHGAVDDLTFCR